MALGAILRAEAERLDALGKLQWRSSPDATARFDPVADWPTTFSPR